MTCVIFDLNRTLYDPDTNSLLPGVLEMLTWLRGSGAEMHLVSRKEPGREHILESHGILSFFSSVSFVEEKTREMFAELVERTGEGHNSVYVIGDYLHEEIRFGNQCGAKTVWLKRGKFAGLLEETDCDKPWRTVECIAEITGMIY